MGSSTQYELKVRACQAGCGPWSTPVTFSVALPAVPTSAPTIGAQLSSSMLGAVLKIWPASAKYGVDGTTLIMPVCNDGMMSAVSSGTGV